MRGVRESIAEYARPEVRPAEAAVLDKSVIRPFGFWGCLPN